MSKNVNTDLIAGLVGLAITALFWFSLEEVSRLSIIFPKAMVGIMALVSVGLLAKGVVAPERGELFATGDQRRVVVTGITLFVWVVAISWLGFYVSSVAAIAFLAYYLALARRRVSLLQFGGWVLIIAAEVAVFYLIFNRLLYVPLPEGIFM
ncbi:MAG: tripartite tricarboxylate transporter TctB family protein [Syntrophales bacterium]|nr:tripartite tricarboxylate transporter TctB family protein [Syntrophales bacterium]